jgi:hypothetical protein
VLWTKPIYLFIFHLLKNKIRKLNSSFFSLLTQKHNNNSPKPLFHGQASYNSTLISNHTCNWIFLILRFYASRIGKLICLILFQFFSIVLYFHCSIGFNSDLDFMWWIEKLYMVVVEENKKNLEDVGQTRNGNRALSKTVSNLTSQLRFEWFFLG